MSFAKKTISVSVMTLALLSDLSFGAEQGPGNDLKIEISSPSKPADLVWNTFVEGIIQEQDHVNPMIIPGADKFEDFGVSQSEFRLSYGLSLRVLNMSTWDEQMIQYVDSDEGFENFNKLLLKNLARAAYAQMKPLIVDRETSLAALFAYYHFVDRSLFFGKTWSRSWALAFEGITDGYNKILQERALEFLSRAEKNLQPLSFKNRKVTHQQNGLFVLAKYSQPDYLACLNEIFLAFIEILKEDYYSSELTEESFAIFNQSLGAGEQNSASYENPHIEAFKYIYEAVNRIVMPVEERKE